MPRILILAGAALSPAYNDDCDPSPNNVGHPWSMGTQENHEIFNHVIDVSDQKVTGKLTNIKLQRALRYE